MRKVKSEKPMKVGIKAGTKLAIDLPGAGLKAGDVTQKKEFVDVPVEFELFEPEDLDDPGLRHTILEHANAEKKVRDRQPYRVAAIRMVTGGEGPEPSSNNSTHLEVKLDD